MLEPSTVRILLVEDNPGDARLFEEALKEAYVAKFELVHCTSLGHALDCLASAKTDVIVVDLGLPDAFGIEVVKKVRIAAVAVPVVVLTSRVDEALGIQALHEGAQDYLIKGELNAPLLSRALRYAMERHEMQEALRNESVIDDLTQIYNRRGFVAVATSYMKLAARTRTPFSLVFIDLDGMKPINDTLGHLEGDRALIETADLLKSCLRQSDILARLGGDEFVLLLAATDENTDEIIRRRVQERFDSCNAQPGRRYKLSFSMGIVTTTAETPPALEKLMAQADAAMYKEKQRKKKTATPAIFPG